MYLKYTFFALLFFFKISLIFSQKVTFGVKGGVNYSTQYFKRRDYVWPNGYVSGADSKTWDYKTGLKLGVFSDIHLNDNLSLSPGLLFNQRGLITSLTFYESGTNIYTKTNKVSLHYLSLDIPLKVKLKNDQFFPYLLVGPRVDFLLGYSQSQKPVDQGYRLLEWYQSDYEQLHRLNMGLVTTIGVEKSFTSQLNAFLEFEYNPDLLAASNEPPLRIRNTLFAINTGIRWKKM